jgi:hypothetical protein
MKRYLVVRQTRVDTGELEGGPLAWLFPQRNGEQLSSSTPTGIVQRTIASVNDAAFEATGVMNKWGEEGEYGSHSLRRGGVTVARSNGVSMLDIQRHGRWKSLVVFSYVGSSEAEKLAVTQAFLRGSQVVNKSSATVAQPGSAAADAAAASVASSNYICRNSEQQLLNPHLNTLMQGSIISHATVQAAARIASQAGNESGIESTVLIDALALPSASEVEHQNVNINHVIESDQTAHVATDSEMSSMTHINILNHSHVPLSSPTRKRKELINAIIAAPRHSPAKVKKVCRRSKASAESTVSKPLIKRRSKALGMRKSMRLQSESTQVMNGSEAESESDAEAAAEAEHEHDTSAKNFNLNQADAADSASINERK